MTMKKVNDVLESVFACRNNNSNNSNTSSKHFMAEESSPAMKKITQTNKQINKTKLVRASPLTHTITTTTIEVNRNGGI